MTVVDEIDSEFNGSVLHNMARDLIGGDGDEGVATYTRDGQRYL